MKIETSKTEFNSIGGGYRLWLQAEFIRRCKKNKAYSIRGFARTLGLDSSTVSQLISGRRRASPKLVAKLCDRLGVHPIHRAQLIQSAGSRPAMTPVQADAPIGGSAPETDYQQLSLDAFAAISDWYHYAILELTYVEGFDGSPNWIAKTLKISVGEARAAIERLIRLGLLESQDGILKKASRHITNYKEEISAPALRQLQRQVMEMGIQAMEEFQVPERDISSITFASDPDRVAEAKQKIESFRRELCEFMEGGRRTQVFHLGIQLYPVSRKPREQ